MSDAPNNNDRLQPSWAAHELFALGLTLLLALWIMVEYGGDTAPADHRDPRSADRSAKRAEMDADDEKVMGSYALLKSVQDGERKTHFFRVPIANAMNDASEKYQAGAEGFRNELVSRAFKAAGIKEGTSTEELELIAKGKVLYQTKICFTCHQVDPAVPAPAGLALKAPKFMGTFWGEDREVVLDADPSTPTYEPGGQTVTVKMDEAYFLESIENPYAKVVKGAIPGMAALPTTPEERKALLAYVRSLSK